MYVIMDSVGDVYEMNAYVMGEKLLVFPITSKMYGYIYAHRKIKPLPEFRAHVY